MNQYELVLKNLHTHEEMNMASPSPQSSLRGTVTYANEKHVLICIGLGVIFGIVLLLIKASMERKLNSEILPVSQQQAPYVEPVGSSTSINLGASVPQILQQQLSPVRRTKSFDPLESV